MMLGSIESFVGSVFFGIALGLLGLIVGYAGGKFGLLGKLIKKW